MPRSRAERVTFDKPARPATDRPRAKKKGSFSITLQVPSGEDLSGIAGDQTAIRPRNKKKDSFSITLAMPQEIAAAAGEAKNAKFAETLSLLEVRKKASFSETLWFKAGSESEELLVDSDFQLERQDLQDRYKAGSDDDLEMTLERRSGFSLRRKK